MFRSHMGAADQKLRVVGKRNTCGEKNDKIRPRPDFF